MNPISKSKAIERYKPGVSKSTLLFVAGMLWVMVGIMLNSMAWSWLRAERLGNALPAVAVGFVDSLIIHHFGFLRIVNRNLDRIVPMEGKRCVFSFMPWKSYALVTVMITLGVLLRHSPIPKLYLAVLYIAIGMALILSSVRYLRQASLLEHVTKIKN
jgi:energy-converting hydrogenase Eha subunit C